VALSPSSSIQISFGIIDFTRSSRRPFKWSSTKLRPDPRTVIPKTIQMVINEAATRPEKLYFIDQDTSAPVKNTDSEMLVMDVSVFTVGRNLDNLVVMINLGKYWGSGPDDVPRAVIRTLSRPLSAIMFEEIPEPPLDKNEEGYYSFILT